jgi:hypothetical protein
LPYTARDVRDILVATGTPQAGTAAELEARPIGPQPDLRRAVDRALRGAGGFSGPGLYFIRSKSSGKVLDVDVSWFRGQDNGQKLIQWDSHGGRNQQFLLEDAGGGYYRMRALHSRRLLDVYARSIADGADLQQWEYAGGDNQVFRVEPVGSFYRIVARHSGKVFDVRANSRDNGAQTQQWPSNGGDNQLFSFIRLDSSP